MKEFAIISLILLIVVGVVSASLTNPLVLSAGAILIVIWIVQRIQDADTKEMQATVLIQKNGETERRDLGLYRNAKEGKEAIERVRRDNPEATVSGSVIPLREDKDT